MSVEVLSESGWEFSELGFDLIVLPDLTGAIKETGTDEPVMGIAYVPDFFKAMKRASQAFNERCGNE